MEAGDYIYCHTTGNMSDGDIFAHAGREYLVERVSDNALFIHTEVGRDHCWTMDDPIFREHFSMEKRERNTWDGNILKFNFI